MKRKRKPWFSRRSKRKRPAGKRRIWSFTEFMSQTVALLVVPYRGATPQISSILDPRKERRTGAKRYTMLRYMLTGKADFGPRPRRGWEAHQRRSGRSLLPLALKYAPKEILDFPS